MNEIAKASEIYEERKKAAGVFKDDGRDLGKTIRSDEELRLLLSGFDISLEEIREIHPIINRAIAMGIQQGVELDSIGPGLYVEGIVTGLIMAREREKRERNGDAGTGESTGERGE